MKNLIIIFLSLTFTSLVQCQNSNIISSTEFDNIKINDKKFIDVKSTFGNLNSIENLFGVANEKNIDPDGDFFNYRFDGLSIGFSALLSQDYDKPIISKFEITTNVSNITIRGVTVTIGDNINLLGNMTINANTDGSRSVIYQFCEGCNSFLSIRFNEITSKITSIEYIEQT